MIVDNLIEFANAAAVTTTVGTAEVETLDMLVAADHGFLRGNKPLYLIIQVTTAFATGASGTVKFRVVSDAQDPVQTDGSETQHVETPVLAVADLPLGEKIALVLPPESDSNPYERYLGLQSIVATGALSAGAIDAWISPDFSGRKIYGSADYGHG